MKKLNVIIAILWVIFVALGACKKDKEIMQTTEREDFTAQKILNFKSKIENPEITKSNQTMSTDSAVWYIEALLNFEHCIISNENTELIFDININDSSTIHNVENTTLNINVIKNYYSYFEKMMLDRYNKLENTNKFLYIANVEYKKNALMVNYGIKASSEEKSHTLPYTITDDWHWGHKLGNCSQTILNRDAMDEINLWLNMNTPVTGNVYYTDINFEGYYGSFPLDDVETYTDLSQYGIYMFYMDNYETNGHPVSTWWYCLSADECNYYAGQTYWGIKYVENFVIAPTRDIVNFKFSEHIDIYDNWVGAEIAHKFEAKSGVRHNYSSEY